MYARSRAEGFGPEVRRRILLGTYVLSAGYYDAYYKRAQQVRTLFVREFEQAFALCDVIATPTAPSPAFEMGARTQDPLTMYLADIYTIPASLAGIPAISLPSGLSGDGLPIGIHLVGPAFADRRLFEIAAGYEALRGPFARSPRARAEGGV
jgi:aspartyl-tRNA(Asn)/glutamyl-tRNA(Gln) amidotransferase subunit A